MESVPQGPFQAAHDRSIQSSERVGKGLRFNGTFRGVRHDQVNGRVASKRWMANDEEIGYCSESIEVGPAVDPFVSSHLFGRHEGRGSAERASLSWLVGVAGRYLHQSKVEQLAYIPFAASMGREDIGRLDVAMDESHMVGFLKRFTSLAKQVDYASWR